MARVKPKTVKKAPVAAVVQKHHWKRPGFNAFGAESSTNKKRAVAKFARCIEVEPPETGIHSLVWANAIAPQDCGLLKLPVEVRHKIWTFVLSELCGDKPLRPMKKGNIFYSPNWPDAARDTTALSETCRQIYVDVVGGGVLYKAKQFSFTPCLLLNYLWVINPVHKNSLRSIHIPIKVREVPKLSLPTKAFTMLADLPGLQDFHLEFKVDRHLCLSAVRQPHSYHFFYGYHGPPINTALLHNGREVPYDVLAKVRKCASLREIKDLQTFWLDFNTFDSEPTGDVNKSGYRNSVAQQVPLSGGENGPYHDLEEELRKVMLVQKK